MTRQDRLCGVITPLLTPFERDLSIAQQLYHQHAAECLANGAHYLSPFGTTGEAAGHSAAERMAALEALVVSGAARPDQLMPGTGVCSLSETLTLTRHAVAIGCRAVMVLPPFFHVNATDDGLYRYFGQLIEGVGSDALRLCLYHIPQMTRIGISPELAGRLSAAFPGVVAAYKDSSGDWQNTQAVIRAAPEVSVFPGSESVMVRAMRLGGGGCISAGCNSNVAAIRAVYDAAADGRYEVAEVLSGPVNRHRAALEGGGLIPALKSLKAHQTGDRRWLTLRPPLEDADPGVGAALAETLGRVV